MGADEPLTIAPEPETSPRRRSNRPKRYQKHGLHKLQRAVRTLGARALPSRSTALGRALHEWRTALVADLGGEDTITTQQRALVELAVRTKLLVDSVDAFVLAMPSPVNRQKHCLHPVVRERQSLVSQLQSLLNDLGLERRGQPVDVVAEVAKMHSEPAAKKPAAAPEQLEPEPAGEQAPESK